MTDHRYEEIKEQKQQKTSLPSVYATVSPLADLVHYKSAKFQKNGNTLPDSNNNWFTEKEQEATSPPAAEPTLYSDVTKGQH